MSKKENEVEVSDVCLWLSHIKGDASLIARLRGLNEGEIVILKIGGASGAWRKMKTGGNAIPTPGLKPACDASRSWWMQIYSSQKGQLLPIKEVNE